MRARRGLLGVRRYAAMGGESMNSVMTGTLKGVMGAVRSVKWSPGISVKVAGSIGEMCAIRYVVMASTVSTNVMMGI